MKKFFWIVCCGFICIQLAGCSPWPVRTSTSREPRVDQEISGNRGFIFGKPTSPPREPTFTDRKVFRIEMEIPPLPKKREPEPLKEKKKSTLQAPKEDKVLWGNRGYIVGGPRPGEAIEEVPKTFVYEETPVEKSPVAKIKEKISQIIEPEPEKTTKMRTYKVRKGDTLQKISRKFYGTTKKWPLLYKTNKDKLKSADSLQPGQILIIPEVQQYRK